MLQQSKDGVQWVEKYFIVILNILLPLHFDTYKRRRKKDWTSSVLFIFM